MEKNSTLFLCRRRFFQLIQFSVPPHGGEDAVKACGFLFGTASWLFVDTHSRTNSGWTRLGCSTGFIPKVKIRLFFSSAESSLLFPFKKNKCYQNYDLYFSSSFSASPSISPDETSFLPGHTQSRFIRLQSFSLL